jgi:ATP-binding cassette subfamily C protein
MKSISSRLADGMQGIKPLKSMACEDLLEPFLESDTVSIRKAEQDYVFSRESLQATSEAIMTIALVIGLYLALTLWESELEVLIVFGLLFWRTVSRIAMLQRAYQDASTFQNHFWSLCDAIEQAEGAREPHSSDKTPSLDHAITFRNLTFSYTDSLLLTDVSITVPAGGFTAITGPSGSGKTTVADLITGLLRPQSGEVWIDEVPMSEIDMRAWRRMLGYVPQETLLFHASIFVNVTLRDPDLTRDDAIMALKAAEAWDFVCRLPNGLDTVTGERGAMLSGGQRQRIAIARALARKPRLLILDEVTTGLDPKTEAELCATLKSLRGKVTILAISHQPALVQAADTIYRVENGSLSQRNPHLARSTFSS